MTDLQPDLAAALVAFQAAVPTIPKKRTADMGTYTYKYADLGDIFEAIHEPLKDNGLAVTQSLTGGANGFIGIRTTVWHESGQNVSDTVELPVNGRTPQQAGSQITYFKRYAISAVLRLSTDEDDDGAAASARHPEPQRTALDDALDELDDAVIALNLTKGKVASDFYAQHQKPPRQTDAATVRAFIARLHEENEKAVKP